MAETRLQAWWRIRACLVQTLTLSATLVSASPPYAAARQTVSSQAAANATLSGRLRDAVGQPVSGADVTLSAGKGMNPLHTQTDRDGRFTFNHLHAGSYTVRGGKSGLHSPDALIDVVEGIGREVALALGPADALATSSTESQTVTANQTVEFSDKPNFTVAGVTDWTAVGGHGSDAALRTSEDLARQTLALKASSIDPSPANSAAEKALRDAWNAAPQSYAATRDLGAYYLRTAQYKKAVPLLQTASRIHGAKADDEYQAALACRGVGDPGEARKHLQRALAQQDRADFHRLAAELEERLGDPLASVKEAARATKLDPTEENYFTWGSELLLHRAVWQAVEVFGNGAKAHPASARMKTAWGSALFAGGLYDEAAHRLCEASDLNPADREPYLFMGKAALASPSPLPGVEQRLARFVQMQPELPEAEYLYAMALSRRPGEPDAQRAEALLAKAVALNPGYAEAYLQLGILSFAQHRYAEAIRFYQRAITADSKQAEAHYRLAVAYDRTGQTAQATQERLLHDAIERADAEDVEQKRREVKQFLVVLQKQAGSAEP